MRSAHAGIIDLGLTIKQASSGLGVTVHLGELGKEADRGCVALPASGE